jgi:hypothetical protein
MKTGSFHAVGSEIVRPWSPVYLLPLIGFFQLVLVLLLKILFPSTESYSNVYNTLFLPSLLIFLPSLAALLIERTRQSPLGSYDITYVDRREEGGVLELAYVNTNGKKRNSLVPTSVSVHSGQMHAIGTYSSYGVEGTQGSITILFSRPPLRLNLGFPSAEETTRVYELLK